MKQQGSFQNSPGSCYVSRGEWVNDIRVMEGEAGIVNEGQSLDVNLGFL